MTGRDTLNVEDVLRLYAETTEEGGWLVVPTLSASEADAVSYTQPLPQDPSYNLDVDDLCEVESDLLPEDVVRVLFLAVDDLAAWVLQKCVVKMGSRGGKAMVDSFSEWARRSSPESNWKNMFLEALAVIGRLDILDTIGLSAEEIRNLQHPVYLSSLKVALNTICCHLREGEVCRLVKYMQGKYLPNQQPPTFPDGQILGQLLELYILYWMQEQVIDLTDLSALAEALDNIGRDDLRTELVGEPARSSSASSAPLGGDRSKVVNLPSVGDLPPSKMYPNTLGVCMIFNQEHFSCRNKSCKLADAKGHGTRWGSDKDASNLESLFKDFGCRAKIFNNLKASEIKTCLEHMSAARDLRAFDYLAICFLSHGGTDEQGHFIYSSDCQKLWLDDLVGAFNSDRCRALSDKLKLVITQACQGLNQLEVVVADGPDEGGPEGNMAPSPSMSPRYTTPLSDFLFCQATTPGFKAYRDPERGSFYISRLCEVFRVRGHLEEVTMCVKDAHNLVSQTPILLGEERVRCAMQPQMIDRLTGRFVFRRNDCSSASPTEAPAGRL